MHQSGSPLKILFPLTRGTLERLRPGQKQRDSTLGSTCSVVGFVYPDLFSHLPSIVIVWVFPSTTDFVQSFFFYISFFKNGMREIFFVTTRQDGKKGSTFSGSRKLDTSRN